MNWTIIKVVAAHIGADYGYQTSRMAIHKNHCAMARAQHIACVAGSFTAAMATDGELNLRKRLGIVAINTATHWLIDGIRMPKVLDQALHVAVAVVSVLVVGR